MKELIKSLCAARTKFGAVTRDGSSVVGGGKSYKYATLDAIVAATTPALAAEGLHVYHTYKILDGLIEVTCHLTNGDAELLSVVCLPTEGIGGKGNPAQAVGSLLTYGRRYSISALLCICVESDDDAGSTEISKPEPAWKSLKSPEKPVQTIKVREGLSEKALEWLNSKYDSYGLTQAERERITKGVAGKKQAEILIEIEEAAAIYA